MSHRLKSIIPSVVGLGFASAATIASASPGSGVVATNTFKVPFNAEALVNHDRIKFQTKDPTDVLNQDMSLSPGAYSGWHHHPGLVIFTVKSGTVTVWDNSCAKKTYGPGHPNGAVFVEHHDDAMQVTSSDGATAHVTLVLPREVPPRIEDQVPFCATSL